MKLYYCMAVLFWHIILSSLTILHQCLKHVDWFEVSVGHCDVKMPSDEQHVLSSHKLQIPLMLMVEFSKMYYTM
jgi:hypothetical protein